MVLPLFKTCKENVYIFKSVYTQQTMKCEMNLQLHLIKVSSRKPQIFQTKPRW